MGKVSASPCHDLTSVEGGNDMSAATKSLKTALFSIESTKLADRLRNNLNICDAIFGTLHANLDPLAH
jgi:hypothetical protein